ncbi:hypothetical protein HID58_055331 [Brassica napus]|uniref:Uncharacterized protein n=1 Tax=Brassica napus TaxID=3708 RepID=A0ABQ8AK77_BRANA|nr:hypothetical protein HID58_055331 [Brassica napus]
MGRTEVGTRFQKSELKNHCYEIKNFKLTHASERVQLTKNLYHINLSNSSVILKIDPIRNSNFYCFPNFIDVYRGLVHPKFPIEPIDGSNGFIDHKIRSQHRVSIHHFNVAISVLLIFQYLWNLTDANVVFLCFKILVNELGSRSTNVTNIDGFSKIVFEPNDVPEIDAFRLKIANEEF